MAKDVWWIGRGPGGGALLFRAGRHHRNFSTKVHPSPRGSSNCGLLGYATLDNVINATKSIGDYQTLKNGKHVSMRRIRRGHPHSRRFSPRFSSRYFMGIIGWRAKQLLGFLRDRKCSRYGRMPFNYLGDNNANSVGWLTVSWVK